MPNPFCGCSRWSAKTFSVPAPIRYELLLKLPEVKMSWSWLVISLLAWNVSASPAEVRNYSCRGSSVSGTVQVRLARQPSEREFFPPYTTRSRLTIGGRAVSLSCSGDLSYFEREIWGGDGAWRYDTSIRIYALCGANLHYSEAGEGFHLEVSQGGGVRGYLGHRDHRQGHEDLSRYDFRCTEL